MPYRWTPDQPTVLTLWPYRSLPRRGFAAMILMAFTLGTIPLYGLLGTVLLWGILPFVLIAVAALWWGLERSYRDGEVIEELSRQGDDLCLVHRPARGPVLTWQANVYWVRAELHPTDGPVEDYVTLTGNGRTVEIGRFLSPEERQQLFDELTDYLRSVR
ncbi:DUF2244 domain-containing protein [Shimia biformata]|uniref:DUF2244 domain-containing protein n=1 Tax=Shimia biformata TaxID=1294299 RepID=UPI00194E79C4|nr:DUF2244 domain-containing protein [Shimia biformata]